MPTNHSEPRKLRSSASPSKAFGSPFTTEKKLMSMFEPVWAHIPVSTTPTSATTATARSAGRRSGVPASTGAGIRRRRRDAADASVLVSAAPVTPGDATAGRVG